MTKIETEKLERYVPDMFDHEYKNMSEEDRIAHQIASVEEMDAERKKKPLLKDFTGSLKIEFKLKKLNLELEKIKLDIAKTEEKLAEARALEAGDNDDDE